MTTSGKRNDCSWVFVALETVGDVALPCLYYDPCAMFNIEGAKKPAKENLDRFLLTQLAAGVLFLSDADGDIVDDYSEKILAAKYLPPSERKRSLRIGLSEQSKHR